MGRVDRVASTTVVCAVTVSHNCYRHGQITEIVTKILSLYVIVNYVH